MKRLEKCCCINIIIEFFSSQGGNIISESSFLFTSSSERGKKKKTRELMNHYFLPFFSQLLFSWGKRISFLFFGFCPDAFNHLTFPSGWEMFFFLDLQYIQVHLCKGRKKIAKNCIVSQLVKNEKWMFWERLIFEGLFKRVIDEIGALFKVSKGQNWSFMGFKKCFGLDGGCLTYIKKRKIMRSS